jgi:hypothetical protein
MTTGSSLPRNAERRITVGKYGRKVPAEAAYKISEEAAQGQIREFLDFYDVGVDDAAEEAKVQERALDKVADYYRLGLLENGKDKDGSLTVIQHLEGGDTLTYATIRPKYKKVTDRFKRDEFVAKTYALMGAVSGLGDKIADLKSPRDQAVVEALSTLFFLAF